MGLQRRTFVIGGHTTQFIGKGHQDFIWKRHADFGTRENPTLEEYITSAVQGALTATGTTGDQIDKAWIGNFVGELFSSQGHLGAALVGADAGLMNKPSMRVEGACASGGLAFASAVESIQAGADVNLVVGAEVQTTESARVGGDYLARASHYRRQRSLDDFTFPCMFAIRAKAYREAYGIEETEIDRVAVKAYENANRNPLAHMHGAKMTMERAVASDRNPRFLANETYAPFMKVSDCSQVSDGGAALIVVSEDGLAKLGKRPEDAIEVCSVAVSTGNLYEDADVLRMDTTHSAATKAYQQSGYTPAQMNIAEVHDCFTVTELLMLEALGFADHGGGAAFNAAGHTGIEGRLPVNTGGGLVGFGHPVGATGVKQVLEIFRQMKGQCDQYQVPGTPNIGLAANMGGNDKTAVVSIFRNL